MGCRACNKIYSPLLFRPSQPLGKLLALHLDQASFGGSPLGRPTVLPSTSPILAWRRPRTGSPILPTTHTHTQRPRHTAVQPLPGHSAGRPWLPARRAHTPDVHALDLSHSLTTPARERPGCHPARSLCALRTGLEPRQHEYACWRLVTRCTTHDSYTLHTALAPILPLLSG